MRGRRAGSGAPGLAGAEEKEGSSAQASEGREAEAAERSPRELAALVVFWLTGSGRGLCLGPPWAIGQLSFSLFFFIVLLKGHLKAICSRNLLGITSG